jgi:hypothetical protein
VVPRILHLQPKTYKQLIRLPKQAERDGASTCLVASYWNSPI